MPRHTVQRWIHGIIAALVVAAVPTAAFADSPSQSAAQTQQTQAQSNGGPTCAHLQAALALAPDLSYYPDVQTRAQQCGLTIQPATSEPDCAHLVDAVQVAPDLRDFPGVASRLEACADNALDTFQDLSGYGWALADIEMLAKLGIIRGEDARHFNPGGHLTRVEFAALMTRLFHLPQPAQPEVFVDVLPGYWGYADVEAAATYMSTFTVPSGVAFEPQLDVTRIEVAATIGRIEVAEGLAQLPSAQQADAIWGQFSDGAQVPPGLAQYGAVALEMGFMQGYPDGSFGVLNPITRAEAAVLLGRVLRASETTGAGTSAGGSGSGSGSGSGGGSTTTSGWLVGVQPTTVTVGVYGTSGMTLSSYLVASGAQVTLNGQSVGLTALPAGDSVTATVNSGGELSAVAATTPALTVVSGAFEGAANGAATLQVGGQNETVPVGSAPVVVADGQITSLGALASGTQVTVDEGAIAGSALIVAGA
jgi:hypothetical protein